MNRGLVKRLMPPVAKAVLENLRDYMNGPGIEYHVLRDIVFAADQSPVPRINLLLPDLSSAAAFGGVATGLNFFDRLAQMLAAAGVEARIVSEKPIDPSDNAALRYPALSKSAFHALKVEANILPTRAVDLFVVFNWWTSLNLESVLSSQARHFQQAPRPKLHLIQDYEPGFYAFSAAHLLAREAMGAQWPLWAIFNTAELHAYWLAQGHTAEKSYVFEPRIDARLRPFARELDASEKEKLLLVYGRPQVPRNAFFLVERALEEWARKFGPNRRDWRILSVGMQHRSIPLGDTHRLESLGKISLEDYGRLLRKTAVGLSLMVSPHPSYPPLEMAHFGARTLTNAFPKKWPSSRHENLVTLRSSRPTEIAEALEAEIERFLFDPAVGMRGKSSMPDYLEDDAIECLDDVASDILRNMGLAQPARPELRPGPKASLAGIDRLAASPR